MQLMFLTLLLICSLVAPIPVSGQENFDTSSKVEYKIEESGKTVVTNTISLTNKNTQVYVKSYILYLTNALPYNIKAYEAGEQLKTTQVKEGDTLKIIVDFQKAVTGAGKTRTFVITYEDENLAEKMGEVWEISIPRITNGGLFKRYTTILSVPSEFGTEAYISPEPRNIEQKNEKLLYSFEKEDLEKIGITAGFGQFQVFSFSLNYHLENPLNKNSVIEIAIPPDTSTQRIYYQKIDPAPEGVRVDSDGNWLATYELDERQRLDVKVAGVVQIFAKPRKFITPKPSTLLSNTRPTQYWQSEDPEIIKLAQKLKTPRAIYDYVTTTLSYDYNRVKPNVARLGAKQALVNPKSAICMEFTDLFIALTRAAGIPAREINGYAYSENPKIQPLSLVSDVLHAWPEYWDANLGIWIPVDPTWGTTTGGVDYFEKLDLRHFTFVVHGIDSQKPYSPGSYKLGANPQKDVFVSFGKLPEKRTSDIQISHTFPNTLNPFKKIIKISLKNGGPAAAYDVNPQILFGETSVSSDFIPVMPAFSVYEKTVTIPYGFLSTQAPSTIVVKAHHSEISIPTEKEKIIIYQLIFICFILLVILVFVHYKTSKRKIFERSRAIILDVVPNLFRNLLSRLLKRLK